MEKNLPANEALRRKDGVIDQRKKLIDPGNHRVDQNKAAKRSQKQPGQDLRDPQDGDRDAE